MGEPHGLGEEGLRHMVFGNGPHPIYYHGNNGLGLHAMAWGRTPWPGPAGHGRGLPAMGGYRAADITIKALENAGPDITREGMIAAIEGMSEYTDLFGYTLTFGPEDHKGVDGSVLSQVQDGRWVTLGTSIRY